MDCSVPAVFKINNSQYCRKNWDNFFVKKKMLLPLGLIKTNYWCVWLLFCLWESTTDVDRGVQVVNVC